MTNTFLTGCQVDLRALELDDLPLFWQWFADRDVVRYSLSTWLFPTSRLETQEWLERTIRDKHTFSVGIVMRATGQLIGYAGIAGISPINRSGEYFIFIGDRASWGHGYGTDVTQLVVAYGFRTLNLNRIALTVSEVNTGGMRAYAKAGFEVEGRLRQACYRDGAYHDKLVMAMLRDTWRPSDEPPAERQEART